LLGLLLVFASISGESDADKNIWSSELSWVLPLLSWLQVLTLYRTRGFPPICRGAKIERHSPCKIVTFFPNFMNSNPKFIQT
jgi:hypothetical protein